MVLPNATGSDALGNPLRVILTAGQVADIEQAECVHPI